MKIPDSITYDEMFPKKKLSLSKQKKIKMCKDICKRFKELCDNPMKVSDMSKEELNELDNHKKSCGDCLLYLTWKLKKFVII